MGASGFSDQGRDLGGRFSASVVLFHYAVAERLGLSAADHKALELVLRYQPIPVSRLAALTHLSPSSATGLVDRLESAGFVRRRPAPDDRRKILVVATIETQPELAEIFGSLGREMSRMLGRFTNEELLVIKRYVEQSIDILHAQTERLTSEPGRSSPRRSK